MKYRCCEHIIESLLDEIMEDESSYYRYLMVAFTLFGFLKKNGKDDDVVSTAHQLSSSAPNRLTTRKKEDVARDKDIDRVKQMDGAGPSGSPASKTEPIAIKGAKSRLTTSKSASGSRSLSRGSLNSVGSGGSSRRLRHGTPGSHHGSKSVLGSFLTGSAGSSNPHTPRSYSKSHEAVWNQAYMNSCR